jgi:hypothetical protein
VTYREILLAIPVGASHTFATRDEAQSARKAACKLYDGRCFVLAGTTLTRTA